MSEHVIDLVVKRLKTLPENMQRQVLRFTETLAPRGVPGRRLLQFAGVIPADDLEVMILAIDEGCEQVDVHDW